MQRKLGILAGIVLLLGMGAVAPPAAAQYTAGLTGTITDLQGNPMAGATVILKSLDYGTTYTMKTDKGGNYRQMSVRPGPYELTLKIEGQEKPVVVDKLLLPPAPDNRYDIDLRKRVVQPSAEQQAEIKKQEENEQKFESMKAAFTDGQSKVEEADKARAQMMKAPADQRATMQPQVSSLYQSALQSFQQAQKAAPEKDPNLHLVYEKLGYANEMLGNYDAAIEDYQKAIELKPGLADYYNILSVAQAKAGKPADASQTCEKSTSLDAARGASCWLNLGIVLYNKNHLPEAVPPLQKATSLNPKNPQAWYLLGASLVAMMTAKQEGEKIIPVLAPGTVEAYQKCIELDPNGTWGAQAKAGLEQLQAMGAGVDTKIKVKKGKG